MPTWLGSSSLTGGSLLSRLYSLKSCSQPVARCGDSLLHSSLPPHLIRSGPPYPTSLRSPPNIDLSPQPQEPHSKNRNVAKAPDAYMRIAPISLLLPFERTALWNNLPPATMVEPLANELIDSILEFLYFDKAALKKCALVGKAWVRASQQGLFETIVLKFSERSIYARVYASSNHGPIKTKLEQLIAMFDEKPYLASYVCSLEVVHYRPEDFFSQEATPLAAQVIQRLSKVKHVLLYHCEKVILSDFSILREALYDLFNLPSLTRVTVQECRFGTFAEVASLLSHATHLKALTIDSLGCFDTDLPTSSDLMPNLPPKSIKLDEFVVTAGAFSLTPWFEQESCPFQVQDLHFFRTRLSRGLKTSPQILQASTAYWS
ncbi:hypothetical protein BT96DRAFT_619575 [Gymnopus androsaceus JB14]|uniref:Uncharacterized protein n=1 Tax=Gymnopus androsaceus JB14 TaxID=1447944 RepID=A0A6A4HUF8_9AGAR|nr:hypothetical protein BT96DRAFT_619575 [Gymnopus androsaceus JB14]